MKVKISKNDIIWSYLGYFFQLFTNVIVLPFVMTKVASAQLGLWYTFLSVGQIVTIFDGTFSGSVSRNVTYAWSGIDQIKAEGYSEYRLQDGKTNYRLLVSILKTCNSIYTVISLIALALMGTIGTIYIGLTAKLLDPCEWITAWVIYALGVFLNLKYAYWTTSLLGVGAVSYSQKANVIARISQIIVSIAGLYLGYGIISLAFAYFLSGVLLRLIGKRYLMGYSGIKQAEEEYLNDISKEEIKKNFIKIWHNAKKNGLTSIAAFIITQSTTLICSAFYGLEVTASYGLCLQIVSAMAGIAKIYFYALRPKLTELKVSGQTNRNDFLRAMSTSIFIFWFCYLLEFLVIWIWGLKAIALLKSNTDIPIAMYIYMSIYLFLENNHSLFANIIEMSNIVPYFKASIISSILVLFGELGISRIGLGGIYGLMTVQCIVQLSYNNWKWPSVIFKEYHINPIFIIREGFIGTQDIFRKVLKINK